MVRQRDLATQDPKNNLTGMCQEFGVGSHTCIKHYNTYTGALDTFSRELGRSLLLLLEEASFFCRQVQMIEECIPPASFLFSPHNQSKCQLYSLMLSWSPLHSRKTNIVCPPPLDGSRPSGCWLSSVVLLLYYFVAQRHSWITSASRSQHTFDQIHSKTVSSR